MSDYTPMLTSRQLSPTPCWVAMSAASWPAANPHGDSLDLGLDEEDDGQNTDNFVALRQEAAANTYGNSVDLSKEEDDFVAQIFATTVVNRSIAQPAPAAVEPSQAPTWNGGMAKNDYHGQTVLALCNDGTESVEWHGSMVEDAEVLHPRLARGGGNLAQSKESGRLFAVPMNRDGVYLYQPKQSYWNVIQTFKMYMDALPSAAKEFGGVEHPLLHVREVRIPMDVSNAIDKEIYGHRKGNKAFNQLLCYLGMRSSIDKKANVRTLTFDPNGWNRTGYRLIKGGDVKGGKPTIVPVQVFI